MKKPVPYQFGIRSLLILTTAVAVIIAMSIRIDAPTLFQALVAGYFIFFVGWMIMRVPTLYRNFSELRKRWRQLKRHRIESELDASKRKTSADVARSGVQSERR